MKKFLPILFFLAFVATKGYSDSKTDTTIVPKKTSGSVIVTAPSGNVTITSGSASGQTLLKGSTVKLQTYSGSWLDRLTILNDGKVGIGTATPASTLSITGGDDQSGSNNRTVMSMGYYNTNAAPHFIRTRHNSSAANNAIDFYVSDGTTAGVFPTNAVQNLSLVSGSVGIGGVTAPALGGSTPFTKVIQSKAALRVGSDPLAADGGDGLIKLGVGGFLSSNGWDWKHVFGLNLATKYTNSASVLYTPESNGISGYSGIAVLLGGGIQFFTQGGATTAGTTVNPTPRMEIDSAGAVTVSGALSFPVTSLSDVQATRMGYKEYLGNNTYNGGNQTTISGSNFHSASSSILIPYQTQGNTWRLKFHISYNPIGAVSDEYITINSVTCRASYNQTFLAININGDLAVYYSMFQATNSQFRTIYSGANTSGRIINGDVALASKPNWAY